MKHGLQVLKHGAADLLMDTGWAGLWDLGGRLMAGLLLSLKPWLVIMQRKMWPVWNSRWWGRNWRLWIP